MRRIKWGVLGTAGIFEGRTGEGMRQAENCELYAIAGRNRDKAEDFKRRFGFEAAYDSYDALLADEKVEAVYIPLPNTLHSQWTIKALKAKKHVLCEKPIAPTEPEARAMFDCARENGVILMEAFAYQHSPYVAALKAELDAGTIGDVRFIEAAYFTSDYVPTNIRMRRDANGGCLYDLGVYPNSLILRLMGREPARVQAVATKAENGIDLCTTALFDYEGGAKGVLACGMVLATDRDRELARFQIHGTKGSIEPIRFDFNAQGELSYRVATFDGRVNVKTVQVPQNYRLEVEQMGRCIADGEAPAVSEAFSLANARVIDRILGAIEY